MYEPFNRICEFRQMYPGTPGSGLSVTDQKLDDVKSSLSEFCHVIATEFQDYQGIKYSFKESKGRGTFPSVLHVAVLPPSQQVSRGIYVVICFDLLGRGALVGCAESKTNPQGLNTVRRTAIKNRGIDVDGLRPTTKYNNVFENPREFLYPLKESKELILHIRSSLDLCLYHLGVVSNERLSIAEVVNSKYVFEFDPATAVEARERVSTNIARRRGQKVFRSQLLAAYDHTCAVTNCRTLDVLEAAHIMPYNGTRTNHVGNGLLLRADIHVLFDLGLITVDPSNYIIRLSKRIEHSEYSCFSERRLRLPKNDKARPSQKALEYHLSRVFCGT